MSANPLTAALDALLSITFGGNWPARMLGLKAEDVLRKVSVWTSHKDFTVEHSIRDSVLDFQVSGGTACLAESGNGGRCRIHYTGYDHRTGLHQWAAVHYRKEAGIVPGLAFDEKGLVVILKDGRTIPLSRELTKKLRPDDWVAVYDAIHGTYYGR